ncbi:MAG: stage II sporulation protein M [Myxococcota bacterium]
MSQSTLDVATPERVAVELPLAGVGSRAMAWLIDVGLLFVVALAAYFGVTFLVPDPVNAVLELSRVARALGAGAVFVGLWVYWTAFEVLWQGQTIGKRLMKIRVVRADGSPVTAADSAIRNLLRFVDFLPACYPVGLVTMLFDPRHRRLGDLVAGTVLIREEAIDLSRFVTRAGSAAPLTTTELDVVTDYLGRFDALEPTARQVLGRALLARLGSPVDDAAPPDDADLRARLEALAGGSPDVSEGLADFVTRRRPDWLHLEDLLERLHAKELELAGLTTLDRLYRRASADLAHAQAAFGRTDVARYLNQLCGRAYGAVYRARPVSLGSIRRFFTRAFPAAAQQTLGYTLTSAGVLLLGVLLGATTVALEPGGAERLVDPELLAFIERRELWTDVALTTHAPSELASGIFFNNLRVSFSAFAMGITAGIGTLLLLLYNGLFLGAVSAACVQHDVGAGIFSFIAAHGPVELSIIALTGAAGLVIGHAIIEPGERRRGAHLRERARLAVTLVLGCAPFLVAIGVVEGFVSPGTFFPWPIKLAVGLVSFVGFWRYLLGTRQGPGP